MAPPVGSNILVCRGKGVAMLAADNRVTVTDLWDSRVNQVKEIQVEVRRGKEKKIKTHF